MPTAPLSLTASPIETAAVVRMAEGDAPDGRFGAIATFVGTVRCENVGRQVAYLEYEAYEPLAVKALGLIAGEVAGHWPTVRLAIQHRTGRLDPGEASLVIAAASPHRAEAFQACRYTIERVKQILPVWKREVFAGGEAWVEGAIADPLDEGARQAAYRCACG
jgi:molybdopterin synthase catalytic subunit